MIKQGSCLSTLIYLPFLFVSSFLTVLVGPYFLFNAFCQGKHSFVFIGILIFLIAGIIIRTGQAISSGHFESLFTLKYWTGKNETFKIKNS